MQKLDISKLNDFELAIHNTLVTLAKTEQSLRITNSAKICKCSPSKISKFVKKLGFKNYKEYIAFISGVRPAIRKDNMDELIRIQRFIDDFEITVIDDFFGLLNRYQNIILFGYGPSFICTQYFEYKLKVITKKFIVTTNEEDVAKNLLNKDSLLVIFSTTGKFKSFSNICDYAKEHQAGFILIAEEYNTDLLSHHNNIIFLTKSFQSKDLKPYEKSRALFFIFIELVIQKLLNHGQGA